MKLGKLVLGGGIALIGLIVLVVLIAFLMIDSIAKNGIEKGSTYALGVPTTLNSADVKVLSGEFAMNGLTVSNPEGFTTPHFLALGDGGVTVNLSSLRGDVVTLPTLTLDNISVYLQRADGNTNYGKIMENLKRFESGDTPADQPKAEGGKGFIIDRVLITNVTVNIDLAPIPGGIGELTKMEVVVPEIELTDLGKGDTKPMEMAEVAATIVKAILAAVAENAGQLPGDLGAQLQSGLAQLQSLDSLGIELEAAAGKIIEDVSDQIDDAIDDVQDQIDDGLKDIGDQIGDGLDGLIPGRPRGGGN
ncbi:MAG: hypothetical protein ACF8MJ_10920 [Phycisphaerales bacterium JB050]